MPAQIEKPELLEAIRTDGPKKVVQQFRHNLLPSRVLIDLYSENPEKEVLLFLAMYPTVPSQVLEDLAESCIDPEIQAAIATNPRCTHLLLVRMAKTGGAPVRAALAANKLQNTKITAELLNDPDLFVRIALAGNPAINDNFRKALSIDPEPAVRAALAATAKLPPELIHAFSADESAVVRTNTYAFGKADPELLLGWAQSDDIEAQRLLLTRTKPAPEMIEALGLSPDPAVQEFIKELHEPTPQELLAKAESDSETLRMEAAEYKDLPAEIQHILAGDPNAEVRARLAAHPAIDEEVALFIAASNDMAACKALAANENITDKVKVELCHHESDDVRLVMAYREDLTEDDLQILVNKNEDLNLVGHLAMQQIEYHHTKPELLEKLLAHKRPSLRAFAAVATQLTHTQVRKLMRDECASVRLALCENPILTAAAFEVLAQDWNPAVTKRAKTRLRKLPKETEHEEELEENGEPSLVDRIVNFFK